MAGTNPFNFGGQALEHAILRRLGSKSPVSMGDEAPLEVTHP